MLKRFGLITAMLVLPWLAVSVMGTRYVSASAAAQSGPQTFTVLMGADFNTDQGEKSAWYAYRFYPDNLTVNVPISFDEGALGAEIKVPTLTGAPVTVKIPPGTPNGRTFRVRGKGVQRKDGHRGDLLVTVEVHVPAVLNDQAKAAVQAYREATAGSDLRANLFDGGAR